MALSIAGLVSISKLYLTQVVPSPFVSRKSLIRQAMTGSMRYLSTRGGDERLSFEQTVLTGLAPNGGLYIPEHLPSLPSDWHKTWSKLSFTELALEIYSLFIPTSEIPREDLKALIDKSYSTFRHEEIAPLHQTGDREYILELFHGPTFAFKDVALQFLGNLFEYFLKRKNEGRPEEQRERLTVVGATSGDTGSAAIYGLRSKRDISIFILHPKGRVSPIQEAQMTTVTDDNVFNLAVKGTFDDCQDIVKALFSDAKFNAEYRLGAINSINWARILAQIVYYFSSYFKVLKMLPYELENPKIQYAVPTGNFGDILAGYYAKRLGLPTEQLIVATNANDILTRFWKTGRYEKADSSASEQQASDQTAAANGSSDGKQAASNGGVAETLSPAMDILVSSNFERLLFYLALEGCTSSAVAADGEVDGGQAARVRMAAASVKEWMDKLKTEGRVVVPEPAVEAARRDFIADRASDEQTTVTIQQYFRSQTKFGSYVADPHTAVGLCVARRVAKSNASNVVQIVLSTAHPAKFNDAVSSALSSDSSFDFKRDVLPKEFEGLLDKERKVLDSDNSPEAVKEIVSREVHKLRNAAVENKASL
ncbi:threonine synthase [Microbotryomycetes sp. JL221]|nr:threonine synthase [Microbotryomycetes sp. JL221]